MDAPAGDNVNKIMIVLRDKEIVLPKILVTNMNLLVIAKLVASAIDRVVMKSVSMFWTLNFAIHLTLHFPINPYHDRTFRITILTCWRMTCNDDQCVAKGGYC